jgi:UDP-GlcNAc:undecaprenyl-phosphate GlcNAc-1-phosphate transferase
MFYFIAAFGTSIFFTLFIRRFALQNQIVDLPDLDRKRHLRPVPLLGGVALFLSFWLIVGYVLFFHPVLGIEILTQKIIATFWASSIILVLGVADELHPLSPKLRFVVTSIAIILGIYLGLGLDKITNPFGGELHFSKVLGGILTFAWLMGMMYTTKITDGLDGLATGVVTIGAGMIYLLTTSAKFFQPNVGLLALIFTGVCLGFLLFNFYPAKIFLGESGSLFIGLILGVLAIISGGKLATALLVMAIPAFDLARVIYQRWRRRQSLFIGDRTHLHYQLLSVGLKERTVVLIYYVIAGCFGVLTLVFKSTQKLLALLFLILIMGFIEWRMRQVKG